MQAERGGSIIFVLLLEEMEQCSEKEQCQENNQKSVLRAFSVARNVINIAMQFRI